MTYIETIQRGKKSYYYLTKNIRISKNTWKKFRKYLGNTKPTEKLTKKYAQELETKVKSIKSSYTFLTNDNAETLQDLKESYDAWLKKVPPNVKKKINDDFVIRFTYHTNAIEGNRLTLRQTALILKDKVIPSGIRAEEYNEAVNGKECLEYLKRYKGELNSKFLEKVNEILTKNTGVVYSGRIRFFDVQIEGSHHIPPKNEEVKKHLLNLYKWYSANKYKLHVFEIATIVHAKLTWIHPFEDGNGRTARAVMNYFLMKNGYPMFFIPYEKREQYYQALEVADQKKFKAYIKQMLNLIIDQIRSYEHNKPKK
tara:strand:+ start:194 stop:1129 length:936 start_codon:yes stop_codon:yes gene_type:complete